MSKNNHYDHDMTYIVQVNRVILRLIGLWPIEPKSRVTNVIRMILIIICTFLHIFLAALYILYMVFKLKTFKAKLKIVGTSSSCLMMLIMYLLFVVHENKIRNCVQHVKEDWRNVSIAEDRKAMLKSAKYGRNITIWSAIMWYSSFFMYRFILPLSRGRILNSENVTIRPLVNPNYFVFFDPQITPVYEIVFSVQCLSSAVIYSTAISVCGLSAMFVTHACGQLQILMRRIHDLANGCQVDKFSNIDRNLALIVDHHTRIRNFVSRVENTLRDIYLVKIVGCTFVMCIFGYFVITVGKENIHWDSLLKIWCIGVDSEYEKKDLYALLTYTFIFTSFTVNIFILCYIGEMLSEEGRKVNATSYTTKWYRIPHQKARLLILIIGMSNYPLKITAGKLFDLSLISFSAIIKTSMAYLNFLRAMTI